MMNSISFTDKRFGWVYLLLSTALLGTTVVGRLYETAILVYQHGQNWIRFSYFSGAVLNDLQLSLIGGLVLWPIYGLFGKIAESKQVQLTALFITIFGLANLLLISYFAATLSPLGPEFWAYSIQEMSNTVLASGWANLWSLLLLGGLVYAIYHFAKTVLLWNPKSLPAFQIKWALPLALLVILIPPSWILPTGQVGVADYNTNKLVYFISSGFSSAIPLSNGDEYESMDQEYPYLHLATDGSTLAPFFKDLTEPPNIVFLIVESLGGEFVGAGGQWTGFAPNLDSLARAGLYWENGLSLSGRTFGMMPSIFGSLPPVRNGFMDLGPDYPSHLTLISLLGERGYHTSFFSGFNTYFDKLDFFLQYQDIDFVLNKQMIDEKFTTNAIAESENYWGYDDKSMLGIASSLIDTASIYPRLDIYHTLQSHSPFTVPNQKIYRTKFERILGRLEVTESRREAYLQYRDELTTLLYADDAVGTFMNSYKNRAQYENTIFVITGDHWLIPVPMTGRISRYHVPIIIYSPLLKEPVSFKSVNTHANLTPSLISLLEQKTALSFPDSVHWIGSDMDTLRTFRNTHSLPLMQNKNQITDYLQKEYFLSEEQLFRLEEGLNLVETENDEIKTWLKEQLQQYNHRSHYALNNNKLYPDTATGTIPDGYKFLTQYDSLFNRLDEMGLNADQQFQRARELAFDEKYDQARAITQRLLLEHPDFYDAKLLQGRTNAWQGNYDRAREIYNSVRDRNPDYYDTYNALFDVEYWDGNTEKALHIINEGLQRHPAHEQFLEKKIRALVALNRNTEARQVYDTLQEHHPNSTLLKELEALVAD